MHIGRREFLKAAGGVAGLLMAGAVDVFGADRGKRPNIVLCMADDQGWGDMEYYGHPELETPNFNELSKNGLRFDRFYAAAPVCSPTRGSVMTGRHPNRFGCFKWGYTLRPQEVTIAEVLRNSGYVTGHFGKWHIGSVRRGSQVNPGSSGFDEWVSSPNFFDNDPVMSREGDAVQMEGESSMVTAEAAIDFMRKYAGGGEPFFAVVWFGSPHNPHRGAEEDLEHYADAGKKSDFYAEISGMDRAVGRLRDELRYMGIEEDTVFWYCSDNGGLPGYGATGGRGHKGMVYEGGLRVPAVLEWPGKIEAGRVTDVPCNTVDIYPTLVDIVGAKVEKQPVLDGVSLAGMIRGEMEERGKGMGFWDYATGGKPVFSDRWMKNLLKVQSGSAEGLELEHLHADAGKIEKRYSKESFAGHAAWLVWPWKLHRIENKEGAVKFELYNLERDPGEKEDVFGESEGRDERFKAGLREWLESVVDSLNGEDY
ncbi:Arylsulfatase precursor [Anaerohalosphaera lusitana]|uniref:Arylsulfatase n=1 Tax=Anaerohalosphaera lusitana TaxID=1936003 RepID=A0A1U9NRH3_9BACT|nr:sulfatase-like hydrolase/transferase [Anaerohalosphaera lusitana]AQT70324.1 Arylsulfatase precursor [Anaerohalosphaera lusitana]